MKHLKFQKGITLIALVITIIVLLILAGVSINLVVGENGVLKKAQKSAIETKRAEKEEQRQLDVDVAIMSEYEGTVPGKNDSSQNRTLSGKTTGFSYKNPIIPKGFIASNDGAGWYYIDDAQTEVKGWNDGLVIEDELGNQFVWVPVDGDNVKYEKRDNDDGFVSVNDTETYISAYPDGITTEVEEKASVEKYSGFYVARYEAGLDREENDVYNSGDSTPLDKVDIPVSKYGIKVWDSIDFSNAINSSKKMINTENVKSALITGTAWDTITSWFEKSNIDIKTTNIWGTYRSVDYSGDGYYFRTTNSDVWTWEYGKFTHDAGEDLTSRYFHASGLNKNGYQKNIADMAGNFSEWNAEKHINGKYNYHYIYRGSSAYSANIPVTVRNNNSGYWAYPDVSFRVMLYIY